MLGRPQYAAFWQAISLYPFNGQGMNSTNGYKIKAAVSRLVVRERANKMTTGFGYLYGSKYFL